MGKKKKKSGSKSHPLSPVNKRGVKLGTLLTEAGIGVEILNHKDGILAGDGGAIVATIDGFINPANTGGKLFWTGIGIALLGRLTGFKSLGPIQFS